MLPFFSSFPLKVILNLLELKADDVFLDIGHGIGNATLQAAFTSGCEARGIELVDGRYRIAQYFKREIVKAEVKQR